MGVLLNLLGVKKVFKISYKDLRSDHFIRTMMKLNACDGFDHKVAYNVMRLSKAMEKAIKQSQTEWLALAETMIEKDIKGNLAVKDGDFIWKPGVNPDEARKRIEEFGAKETIVERLKLKVADLSPAKLTPAELSALEPLLEET